MIAGIAESHLMYNLTLFTPKDIMDKWNIIRYILKSSLPPTFCGDPETAMHGIMNDMKKGILQVWIVDQDASPIHISVTRVDIDKYSGETSLFVYAWFSVQPELMNREVLEYSIEKLKQFADTNRCKSIMFYTDNENLAKIFEERYGATKRYFVSMEAG